MRLKVFGQEVKVFRKQIDEMGLYFPDHNLIFISKELEGDMYTETLIHELFEVVFYRLSFYQSINEELKEVLIDCFSKAIAENFKLVNKKHRKPAQSK